MIDRGIIKWHPFDSCYSSAKILNEIHIKKEKETLPILSEDQLNVLEEKIKHAYFLKEKVDIKYFYNGKILNIQGIISYLNVQSKNINLNNKIIYLNQILNISIF